MNDRYLKGVLTVIAGALVWIAIQLSTRPVDAAGRFADIHLVTETGSFASAPGHAAGGDLQYLPVYCKNCK
jgi:hypothetical protein